MNKLTEFEKNLSQDLTYMEQERSGFEADWRPLRELIRPTSPEFNRGSNLNSAQSNLSRRIFDGTGRLAAHMLANGLDSYNTSSTERWFNFRAFGMRPNDVPFRARLWMEDTADVIYQEYSRPNTCFHPTLHEVYLDLVVFGSGPYFQYYDIDNDHLRFKSYPLADCFYALDHNGDVSKFARRTRFSKRQLEGMFPEAAGWDEIRKMQGNERKLVWHVVLSRDEYAEMGGRKNRRNWPSVYMLDENKQVLSEKAGFDLFPYHLMEWQKVAGETYSRSPASSCLPSLRLLNAMKKELLVGAQLANRPPTMVEDGSFLQDIAQVPGAIWHFEAGAQRAEAFHSGQQPQLEMELLHDEREMVRQSFFTDWLHRDEKRERQTAFEIADSRDEKLRLMAPILGRLQKTLGQMLRHSFYLLQIHGKIPEPPAELDGIELDIGYVSPAATAQLGSKRIAIQRAINDLAPAANIDPSVYERLDFDEIAEMLVLSGGAPTKMLKSPEVMEASRQQAAQQQQLMAAAESAPKLAGALKDVSEAQKNNPAMLSAG
jgi:hypothetical protein